MPLLETKEAAKVMAALAQEHRLAVFRILVQVGPAGMPANKIGEKIGLSPSSLSFHLKELSHANLVTTRHEGRFIYYAANFTRMNDLMAFLTDNCCGGNPCTSVCQTDCSTTTTA